MLEIHDISADDLESAPLSSAPSGKGIQGSVLPAIAERLAGLQSEHASMQQHFAQPDGRPLRGLIVGVALSAPFWIGLGWAIGL